MCVTCIKQKRLETFVSQWNLLITRKEANRYFWAPDSGCYLWFSYSCWCTVCPGHSLASHKELPLRDISPCGQKIMLILTSFDIIHYFLSATCNWIKVSDPWKAFTELWEVGLGVTTTTTTTTTTGSLMTAFLDCCLCMSYSYTWSFLRDLVLSAPVPLLLLSQFWQAIMCEWTVHISCWYVTHFKSPLSFEHLESVGSFHIGRPTTDKAWLCSAWVVMVMPLQHSARA